MGNQGSQIEDDADSFENQIAKIQNRAPMEDLDEANCALKDAQVALLRTKQSLLEQKKELELREKHLKEVQKELATAKTTLGKLSSKWTVLLAISGLMLSCLAFVVMTNEVSQRWGLLKSALATLPYTSKPSPEIIPDVVTEQPILLISWSMLDDVLQQQTFQDRQAAALVDTVWAQLAAWPACTDRLWVAITHHVFPDPSLVLSAAWFFLIVAYAVLGAIAFMNRRGKVGLRRLAQLVATFSFLFFFLGIYLWNQSSQAFQVLGGMYCFSAVICLELFCVLVVKFVMEKGQTGQDLPKKEPGRITAARQKATSSVGNAMVKMALSLVKQIVAGYLHQMQFEKQIWVSFLVQSPPMTRAIVELVLVTSGLCAAFIPFGPFAILVFAGLFLIYFEICISFFNTLYGGRHMVVAEATSLLVGMLLIVLSFLSSSAELGKALAIAGNINLWETLFLCLLGKGLLPIGPLKMLEMNLLRYAVIILIGSIWAYLIKSSIRCLQIWKLELFATLTFISLLMGCLVSLFLLQQSCKQTVESRLVNIPRMNLFLQKKTCWGLCFVFGSFLFCLQLILENFMNFRSLSVHNLGPCFIFSRWLLNINGFLMGVSFLSIALVKDVMDAPSAGWTRDMVLYILKFVVGQAIFVAGFYWTHCPILLLIFSLGQMMLEIKTLSSEQPHYVERVSSFLINTIAAVSIISSRTEDAVHVWLHEVGNIALLMVINISLLNQGFLSIKNREKQPVQQLILVLQAIQALSLGFVELALRHYFYSLVSFGIASLIIVFLVLSLNQQENGEQQDLPTTPLEQHFNSKRAETPTQLLRMLLQSSLQKERNGNTLINVNKHGIPESLKKSQDTKNQLNSSKSLLTLLKQRALNDPDSVAKYAEKTHYKSRFQPKVPIDIVRIPSPFKQRTPSKGCQQFEKVIESCPSSPVSPSKQKPPKQCSTRLEQMLERCPPSFEQQKVSVERKHPKTKGDKEKIHTKSFSNLNVSTLETPSSKRLQDLSEQNRKSPVYREVLNQVKKNQGILEIAKSEDMMPGGEKYEEFMDQVRGRSYSSTL